MSEATPIRRFERARREAVLLLRRLAEALEAASPRQALEALERFGHPLQELDRAAQLVLWARATSGRGLRGAPVSAGSARPVAGFLASSVAAVHDEKTNVAVSVVAAPVAIRPQGVATSWTVAKAGRTVLDVTSASAFAPTGRRSRTPRRSCLAPAPGCRRSRLGSAERHAGRGRRDRGRD